MYPYNKSLNPKKSDFYLINWPSASVFAKLNILHCKNVKKEPNL